MKDYTTVYVGMDVHKNSFSLCCYTNEKEMPEYQQKVDAHYSKVLTYIEHMKTHYGDNAMFICGYEAGCLGYTLYKDLTSHNIKCVILAPTSMAKSAKDKKIKTDRRDSAIIARCLAHNDYSAVHIPTEQDEQIKGYIRMRNDHKRELKKIKQEINAFCLYRGYSYDGTKTKWTGVHVIWLKSIKLDPISRETLDEYLATYDQLVNKISRMDKRIEEFATDEAYSKKVKKLQCFIGIKTHSALSMIVEIGDFARFPDAGSFANYLGLTPAEGSSGDDQKRFHITKAGNVHVRTLLIEASQCYNRGKPGTKSKLLAARQQGNDPKVIAYADKANERLRRRFCHLVLKQNKKHNVAKTAIARELACFIWGMMNDKIA